MPSAAIRIKYCAKEFTNCTFPIPSGPNILETYGNVTIGNKILLRERNKLKDRLTPIDSLLFSSTNFSKLFILNYSYYELNLYNYIIPYELIYSLITLAI